MSRISFNDASKELSAAGRDFLLDQGRNRIVKKGEWLLREGQICRNVYFVEEGLIRSHRTEVGRDINLDFHFEGDFVTHLRSLRLQAGADYALQAPSSRLPLFPPGGRADRRTLGPDRWQCHREPVAGD
jgi:hypothetical protein